MTAEFDTHKKKFIDLINQKFAECAATGMNLESNIKGFLDWHLPTLNSIEKMKYFVSDYFSDPGSFDTGSVCSELFMGAIRSFPDNPDNTEATGLPANDGHEL